MSARKSPTLLDAEPIQPTKSAGQNSGVKNRGTKIRASCGGWKIPACGWFTIDDLRKSAHRLIDPSAGHGVGFKWPDGPMARSSRLINTLFKMCRPEGRRYISVRKGGVTHRDVKNEDRSGYVYENTGDADKMSDEKTGFYTKMHLLHDKRQQSVGLLCRECIGYAIKRNGRRQTVDHRQETEYKRLLAARRSLKGKPTSADVAPTFRSALDGQNNIADLKVAATKGFEMPECIRNKRGYR